MNLRFHGKRITGIVAVVPPEERSFVEEMREFDFPEARSRKLMEVMGFDRHRLVAPGVCASDLAVFAMRHLFAGGWLLPEEVDALVLVTQSPDHLIPPTSNIIQGRLGLHRDVLCLDINQGCAGFVVGLIQAFLLLEQEAVRKVVVINADVLSRRTSRKDRNSYPLVGDAASVTVVERDLAGPVIHAALKMDGTRHQALMIPAGGFRLPGSPETAELEEVGDGNWRAKDHLRMDGAAVFNFVQVEVPPLIADLLTTAGMGIEDVDWFFCHQPNRFMLEKLADKLGVPRAKMPMNVVERFGNSSGVTIPLAVVANLSESMRTRSFRVCLAGFGVGLTWGAILMPLGNLSFCELCVAS